MNLYVTSSKFEKIKKSFLNLRLYYIVDVDKIIHSLGYDRDNLSQTAVFILNDKIKEKIQLAIKYKRYIDIIYINSKINKEIILNLQEYSKEFPTIQKIILLDEERNEPNELQKYFKEILFFPSGKKVKIYECVPIKNKLFYWVNNLPIPPDLLDD